MPIINGIDGNGNFYQYCNKDGFKSIPFHYKSEDKETKISKKEAYTRAVLQKEGYSSLRLQKIISEIDVL